MLLFVVLIQNVKLSILMSEPACYTRYIARVDFASSTFITNSFSFEPTICLEFVFPTPRSRVRRNVILKAKVIAAAKTGRPAPSRDRAARQVGASFRLIPSRVHQTRLRRDSRARYSWGANEHVPLLPPAATPSPREVGSTELYSAVALGSLVLVSGPGEPAGIGVQTNVHCWPFFREEKVQNGRVLVPRANFKGDRRSGHTAGVAV